MPRLSLANRPLLALILLAGVSLAARLALLGEPCRAPCRRAADHLLVFDEVYYVNAARVIAGVRPPSGATYARAPLGDDPNSEHPQLAKLLIAGSIELFGDGPLAWRAWSLVFGTLVILGMYALARSAGSGVRLALLAAALAALDNLQLVHGRIGTLDVFALAGMLWAAVAYLRARPVLAGVAIGLGSCFKLVAAYLLLVLVLYELFAAPGPRPVAPASGVPGREAVQAAARAALARLVVCAAAAAGAFLALLAVLDRLAPPWNASTGRPVTGGAFGHIGHIVSYASNLRSPHGPRGIASYPWQWLGDYQPISYLTINPARPSPGLQRVHPAVHFLGMVSPPILAFAIPALVLCGWRLARRRGGPLPVAVPALAAAWTVGTLGLFELLSLIWSRTSYLYYMVIVLPGIYLALAVLVRELRRSRLLVWLWAAAVLIAAAVMYPFTPWP